MQHQSEGENMRKLVLAAIAALTLGTAAPALAADGSTTFGGATVDKGVATLVANTGNTSTTDDSSGVTVPVPTGLTFGQITHLSTDFHVTDDDCGAGSPRFQIMIGGQNVFVALGPGGTLTGCDKNAWLSSGNLTQAQAGECRVDTSKFPGGKQCSSWAEAVALLGSQPVQSVSLLVDASWAGSTNPAFTDKEQTVLVRNVKLNDKTYFVPTTTTPPTAKNASKLCKAQRAAMGTAAFNELWHINAQSNGIGKCVSATNKARNADAQQTRIMNASKACKAKGLKGAKLGQCVAAKDNVAATKTEAQEHRKAKKRK
jgi:hypothetical protein